MPSLEEMRELERKGCFFQKETIIHMLHEKVSELKRALRPRSRAK